MLFIALNLFVTIGVIDSRLISEMMANWALLNKKAPNRLL